MQKSISMPRFSEERGVMLLTLQECTGLTGKSLKTVKRRLYEPDVYTEVHFVRRAGRLGAVRTLFVDPTTLQLQIELRLGGSHDSQKVSEGQSRRVKIVSEGHKQDTATLTSETPEYTKLTKVSEGHVSEGHLARINIHSDSRKPRADKGGYRHNAEQHQLIVQGIFNNPKASARMLHRTLKDACDLELSEATVRRIFKRLKKDPHTKLMFSDADVRKEYLRTYAGEVFAAHANELWQLDMTRCDIEVVDPETGHIFRPRIHAVIDVYSGCIPGFVFSEREDQTQTDMAILCALVQKTAPFTDVWPVFGTPKRLYMDNGKTYKSEHTHRYLSELGIEVVHSLPRVSHTRGKVERVFGTIHGFTKTCPGYVGSNAKERATEELKRLEKNTKNWLARGGANDPGWGNRLLTFVEYRDRFLAWLFTDYHDTIVSGKSRLQHFLETVPANSQRLYNEQDLELALGKRTVRTVNPDGSVRFGNRFWTVASGELANFRGDEVLVLSHLTLPDTPSLIVWQPERGGLEVIGHATLMPERADSDEARLLRANSKAAKKHELQRQTEQQRRLMNPQMAIPNLRLEQAQAELNIPALPQPQRPQARLEAIAGPAEPELDLGDDLTRFLLEGTPYEPGASIDDYFDASKANWKKGLK